MWEMMMRSRVGMYTVRMVPSSLLRWHKYNFEISFEIWKPSKNYFHFNVSSHNQADVGLPATKQIENQSFLLTWWNTGWDPLVRDSWASLAPAPQIHLNCPRTWTLVCLFLSLSFLLSFFYWDAQTQAPQTHQSYPRTREPWTRRNYDLSPSGSLPKYF